MLTEESNLLERLGDVKNDVLRFMVNSDVPLTNTITEANMISVCLKSLDSTTNFSLVRSYLLTTQKHGLTPTDTLKTLFETT